MHISLASINSHEKQTVQQKEGECKPENKPRDSLFRRELTIPYIFVQKIRIAYVLIIKCLSHPLPFPVATSNCPMLNLRFGACLQIENAKFS